MGKTIIQTIGPLYGEVVNGTVFGRPNGSIYVPPTNKVVITANPAYVYCTIYNNTIIICNSAGQGRSYSAVAESQDIMAYIETALYDSDDALVGTVRRLPAGTFNIQGSYIGGGTGVTLVNGGAYTLKVTLYAPTGEPVATDSLSLTGVVVE